MKINKVLKLKKNQIIACLGDSITHANYNGYPEYLQKFVNQYHLDLNLNFMNWGKNSETITGISEKSHPKSRPFLFDRLDNLFNNNPKPDVVFFCYGMNCGIFGEPSEAIFCAFEDNLRIFLDRMLAEKIQVVLITPPPLVFDKSKTSSYLEEFKSGNYSWLRPYLNYNEEVLQEFMCTILYTSHPAIVERIDIHTPLLDNRDLAYGKDPIHPNQQGHKIIAEEIINILL